MNARKAKALRREVYGDQSLRDPRRYQKDPKSGRIHGVGLRRKYQMTKRGTLERTE